MSRQTPTKMVCLDINRNNENRELKHCNISFLNKPCGQFLRGDTITGHFNITLNKPANVEALTLTVVGQTNCRWKGKDLIDKKKSRKKFSGCTIHCQKSFDLLKTMQKNRGLVKLPAGSYTFNFTHRLPHYDIPASFEGAFGSIRYMVRVTYRDENQSKFFNTLFTVLPELDLNAKPHFKIPITKEISKNFGSFGLVKGHLNIKFVLSKSAFVPYENAQILCQIINESTINILKAIISLQQVNLYNVTSPYRCQRREDIKVLETSTSIKEFQSNTFHVLTYQIPNVIPSFGSSDTLVSTFYYFKIQFVTNSIFNKSVVALIPITIGTKPISESNFLESTSNLDSSAPPSYNEAIADALNRNR